MCCVRFTGSLVFLAYLSRTRHGNKYIALVLLLLKLGGQGVRLLIRRLLVQSLAVPNDVVSFALPNA